MGRETGWSCSEFCKKDSTWFVNPEYVEMSYIQSFPLKVYKTIKDNPIIKRHHKKYADDEFAPAWKTMEFMTMGNVLTLYDNLKDQNLKEEIAQRYGCNVKAFVNYFDTIRILRNHCAHGSCIYNIKLPKGIVGTGGAGKFEGDDRHNINGAIRIVKYILGNISQNRLTDLECELNSLLLKKRRDIVKDAIKICGGLG